ncbi:MAG TPA: GAF and ANTAR domain-containing protein [Acidimicrobiales bacterium]|jgi:GAF domain-containing protein|nr:GAF and ANTAR domain-containing protein [Acidimicrobiales bacterium]
MGRESLLIATLVELADNLVDHYDVIDVLTVLSGRCVEAMDVDAAGVMLASPGGELQFVASSSESMRVLELFQIQADEGPCVDCFRSGSGIINQSLSEADGRWPRFTPRALAQGFRSVHSLPLRLRGRTIGALNLFRTTQGLMSTDDVVVAQGLADVATIAILQHRSSLDAHTLNEQLSNALNSRIVIEQAKGIISQATDSDMDQAFSRLRSHARNHNLGLTEVASGLVEGTLKPGDLDQRKAPR